MFGYKYYNKQKVNKITTKLNSTTELVDQQIEKVTTQSDGNTTTLGNKKNEAGEESFSEENENVEEDDHDSDEHVMSNIDSNLTQGNHQTQTDGTLIDLEDEGENDSISLEEEDQDLFEYNDDDPNRTKGLTIE